MLDNTATFSIRDEIGTCPYFEVKLKLRDDKLFFVRPYNIWEDQKPIIQKEMDRLEKLGIIWKGSTGYSSPVLLVKRKQQNLYWVITDFRVLNERLVMSVLNLRDAYHTLPLAEESQKYCGLTPITDHPHLYTCKWEFECHAVQLSGNNLFMSFGNSYQIKRDTR